MPKFCTRTLHFASGELICLPSLDAFTGAATAAQVDLLRRALREAAAVDGKNADVAAIAISVTESALEASSALCFLEQGEVEVLMPCRPQPPLPLAVPSRGNDWEEACVAALDGVSAGSGSDIVVVVDAAAAPCRDAHELHRPESTSSNHLVVQSALSAATGASTIGTAQSASLDALAAALRAPKSLGRVRAGDFFNHAVLSSSSSSSPSPSLRHAVCVARSACTVRVATARERASLEGAGSQLLHAHTAASGSGVADRIGIGSGSDASAAAVARAWQRELMASVMRQIQQLLLLQF
jgi:hypothetical protein